MTIVTQSGIYEREIATVASGDVSIERLVRTLSPATPQDQQALFALADTIRRENVGDGVHLRALIEFSSYCHRTCNYCGLRAPNRALTRYRMEPDEIVDSAGRASELGYKTVVLQSGEDDWYTVEAISDIVRRIKSRFDVAITLCVGERDESDYAAWREAGADRYLLRIETSNPDLYAHLHPGMSFGRRVECLFALKELGYQIGSGVLIGLPGQTVRTLAADLMFLLDLEADMVGMGPFIPHPQTPLGNADTGSVEMTLRMMAACRLVLPRAHIVATTALGTLDPLGREKGLQGGGNVAMPNVTPQSYRALYEIYPSKICINEDAAHCRGCIEGRIHSVGRYLATDHGHALAHACPESTGETSR